MLISRIIPTPAHVSIPKFDEKQCIQLFHHYADTDAPDLISPEGTRQFFEDLGVSIEDSLIFAIAWRMQISIMGYITKEEWIQGMKSLQADSIEKLRERNDEFQKVLTDPEQFSKMYKYTFNYAKNKDQKCMEVETASVLWAMLLGNQYPIVQEFVTFLQERKPVKVINRDQWNSFLAFSASDLSAYDESSAWPVLFDEFVEWKHDNK
ncbi:DCN1-like protein 4 [Choanephora cucurbitarum]|uniref:Defective in cullin neddylation protein n=1 Tax=Choanephora cucurbitarum TaxID=101091 RepID=A0A1C7NMG2_9FUNG|nr:DCN1-like protein 4 [Choanephora cucurbitarum]